MPYQAVKPNTLKDHNFVTATGRVATSTGRKQRRAAFGRTVVHTCRDGAEVVLKSGYERTVAKVLDRLKLDWGYEVTTFEVVDEAGKVRKYTPDFYVPEYGVYIEVKGYMSDHAARLIDLFRKQHPQVRLLVWLMPDVVRFSMVGAKALQGGAAW